MPIIKPRPFDKDDEDIEDNFDNLKGHVEDVDFKPWLPARVFSTRTVGGGGGGTEGCYIMSPFWQLADAVSSGVVTQHYTPIYWNVGYIGGTIYYTGDVGSTNNILLQTQITGYRVDGAALTNAAGNVTTSLNQLIPGPAVADELQTYSIPQTGWLSIVGKERIPYVGIGIGRIGADGTDTYTGSFRLLGMMLQFYPTRR